MAESFSNFEVENTTKVFIIPAYYILLIFFYKISNTLALPLQYKEMKILSIYLFAVNWLPIIRLPKNFNNNKKIVL